MVSSVEWLCQGGLHRKVGGIRVALTGLRTSNARHVMGFLPQQAPVNRDFVFLIWQVRILD